VSEEPIEAVCLFLGSFEQVDDAAAVEQRLLSLDIRSRVQSMDAAAGVDYWVYLPPLASRQASLRQLRELQARKIDSYIITQGDLSNGISLGIFPRSDSAESVMQRLRDAGYEPLLRELTRAHRSFWVRIAPESRRLADDSLLERLAFDFKGLQHQLMPCEGIASPR
jgi:cell division septation protein DedD